MSVFIDLPWTEYPANGIYKSADQVKETFNIIVKAFLYKFKYETASNKSAVEKFNLNNDRVYAEFVNLTLDNLLDPVTRDYVLATIRNIRKNNFSKKSVKISYQTLYTLLEPKSKQLNDLREFLAESQKIVDFYSLFNTCNTKALTPASEEIKEIVVTRNIVSEMSKFEIKNFK